MKSNKINGFGGKVPFFTYFNLYSTKKFKKNYINQGEGVYF